MTILQGICKGGPLDGKVQVNQSRRWAHRDTPDGFYVHQPAQGPTPAAWRWIEIRKDGKQ